MTKAAVTTATPGRGASHGTRFTVVGQPANPQQRRGTGLQMVTPSYVETLGMRLTNGRNISEHDTATSMRVATVNEYFAKRYFPDVDPLTQRISFEEMIPGQPRGKPIEWQIVGVFHNVRGAGFREENPEINVPFAQSPWPQASMAIKTQGDPKN